MVSIYWWTPSFRLYIPIVYIGILLREVFVRIIHLHSIYRHPLPLDYTSVFVGGPPNVMFFPFLPRLMLFLQLIILLKQLIPDDH
jgi:hypothetical protein